MSGRRSVWKLIPAGRCRQLLLIALGLASLSAAIALVPALVIYVIAAVLFEHIDVGLTVMQLVFVAIASVIARLGFLLLARNTAGSATELLTRRLRADAATKIGALPLGVLAGSRPAAFETLLLDDVETVGQYVSERLVDIAGAYAMLVVAFAILYWRDWRLASIVLAATLAAGALLRARAARAGGALEEERSTRESLGAAIFQSVRSLTLAKSLPQAPESANSIASLAGAYRRAMDVRLASDAALQAERRAFAGSLAAIAVLAGLWLHATNLTLPVLVLFAAVTLRTSGALGSIFTADVVSAPARRSAQRIHDLLGRPSQGAGTLQPSSDTALRFSDVSFTYPGATGHRDAVLRDLSFVAEAGKVTAIVGPSGSGKTTLNRLAARFWDVDRGSVSLGDVDLREIAIDSLMQRIACVFQDVALLDDTVSVNLRLGRPEASDDAMVRAAQAAGAHAFIAALPAGYETVIGDRGLRLSRGERQRLQIARALLKDAPIVILDEPTASMDPVTEADIGDALIPLLRDKTVLVVAHRLATIVHADKIVVLSREGTIAAQGTHAELLGINPTYAQLWDDYGASLDWDRGADQIVAR